MSVGYSIILWIEVNFYDFYSLNNLYMKSPEGTPVDFREIPARETEKR